MFWPFILAPFFVFFFEGLILRLYHGFGILQENVGKNSQEDITQIISSFLLFEPLRYIQAVFYALHQAFVLRDRDEGGIFCSIR